VRRAKWVAGVAILAACLIAPAASSPASRESASPHAGAAKKKKKRRPGCGTFCKQAGGIGGGPGELQGPVTIPAQTVTATHSFVVGLRGSKCTLQQDCVGAVLLSTSHAELGRADLSIKAGSSSTVKVGLNDAAVRVLRKRHRITDAFAAVVLKGNQPLSTSGRLTIKEP
jgi:hypothetical protein